MAGHVKVLRENAAVYRRSLIAFLQHTSLNWHLTVILEVVGLIHLLESWCINRTKFGPILVYRDSHHFSVIQNMTFNVVNSRIWLLRASNYNSLSCGRLGIEAFTMAFELLSCNDANIPFGNDRIDVFAFWVFKATLTPSLIRCLLGKSSAIRCMSHVKAGQQRSNIRVEEAISGVLNFQSVEVLHPVELVLQRLCLTVVIL